jgi:hypothetical protein
MTMNNITKVLAINFIFLFAHINNLNAQGYGPGIWVELYSSQNKPFIPNIAHITLFQNGSIIQSTDATPDRYQTGFFWLEPGLYDVVVEATGYKTVRKNGIRFIKNQSPKVSIIMEKGSGNKSLQSSLYITKQDLDERILKLTQRIDSISKELKIIKAYLNNK